MILQEARYVPLPPASPAPPPAPEVPLRLVDPRARPLSVGVVLHDFALGGTERIAVRLANRWAQDGADVRLFAGAHCGPLQTMLDPAVRLVLPRQPVRRAPGSPRRLAAAASTYFAAEPVDACFVPGNYHWPVAAALASLPDALRPMIATQVSAALRKPQRGPVRQYVFDRRMRRLLDGADALVALCSQAGRQADGILGRRASVPIALPALDDDGPAPRPCDPDGAMILAVGRLVPEKGFDLLIDAFARLRPAVGQAAPTLVILGEGPDRARLEALVTRHGMQGRVTMPGYVPDTRPWLDRCRLFVLPSRFEGYPAVIVEALAAGRQVVATRCTSAVGDLLRDTSIGRGVPIEDPVALASAIAATLADRAPDPARLAATVEHHRIGVVARDYLRLFHELVDARG